MKHLLTTLLFALLFNSLVAQDLISGNYEGGLTLSYDSTTKKVTGYYESHTGNDFSCIFYLEGIATGKTFSINTFYPTDYDHDIQGTLEIVSNKKVTIKLASEHGGCWNVQHFTDEPVSFTLAGSQPWMQIRYVENEMTFFHSDKADDKKLKSYLIRGNIISVEKIEGDWALCSYYGKKVTKGWLRVWDLNELEK